MVAPSRLFEPPLCFNHCSQSILHPGIGCCYSFVKDTRKNFLGGLKYFSPLLITPLVLKCRRMDRDMFAAMVKYYLESVFWTTLASTTSFSLICVLRNLLGRYTTYTTLFVPTVLGMQFCWFFPTRLMKLFCTATSQSVLEALLRQNKNRFTRLLLHSKPLQTFLFMINSAIILHYKRLNVYRDFWFMQPYEKDNSEQSPDTDVNSNHIHRKRPTTTKCVHAKNVTCSKFVWDGVRSYLIYGIAVDLLSIVLKQAPPARRSRCAFQRAWRKAKGLRPNMTGFFIFYSGIYRMSSCLLQQHYGHLSEELRHILAAFLGGSSFLLMDKLSFWSLSTVIAVQILWQRFCKGVENKVEQCHGKTSKRKPNAVLMLLRNFPFSHFFFSMNMGYLVHNFVMNYNVLNSFTQQFLDGLTANKTKSIKNAIALQTMKQIMYTARRHPVRVFF